MQCGYLGGTRQKVAVTSTESSAHVLHAKVAHPTMLRSSDCLFSASVLILASTRLTSLTGSRRKTSSGSMPAQSRSLAGSYFLRALDAVDTEEGG